jgi:cell division protein FtsB
LRTLLTSQQKLAKMTESNNRLNDTIQELQTEVDKLKNDNFYIETIARRDYKMVKKDEIVYIFSRR